MRNTISEAMLIIAFNVIAVGICIGTGTSFAGILVIIGLLNVFLSFVMRD